MHEVGRELISKNKKKSQAQRAQRLPNKQKKDQNMKKNDKMVTLELEPRAMG